MDLNWGFYNAKFRIEIDEKSSVDVKLTAFINLLVEYDYKERYPVRYSDQKLKMDVPLKGTFEGKSKEIIPDFVYDKFITEYKFTLNTNSPHVNVWDLREHYSLDNYRTEVIILHPNDTSLKKYFKQNTLFKEGFHKSLNHLIKLNAFKGSSADKLLKLNLISETEISELIPESKIQYQKINYSNDPDSEIERESKLFLLSLMDKIQDWIITPPDMLELIPKSENNLNSDIKTDILNQKELESLWDRDCTSSHNRWPNLMLVPHAIRFPITSSDLTYSVKHSNSKVKELLKFILILESHKDEIEKLQSITKKLGILEEAKNMSGRTRHKLKLKQESAFSPLNNVKNNIQVIDGKASLKPSNELKKYISKRKDPSKRIIRNTLEADCFAKTKIFQKGPGLLKPELNVKNLPLSSNPILNDLMGTLCSKSLDDLEEVINAASTHQIYSDYMLLTSILMSTIVDDRSIRDMNMFFVKNPLENLFCFTTPPLNDTHSGAIVRIMKVPQESNIPKWYGDYEAIELPNSLKLCIFKPIRISWKWIENIEENWGSYVGSMMFLKSLKIIIKDDLFPSMFLLPSEMLLGAADLIYLFYRQLIAIGNLGRFKVAKKVNLMLPTGARESTILYRLRKYYKEFYIYANTRINDGKQIEDYVDPIFRWRLTGNQSCAVVTYMKNLFGKEHSYVPFNRFKKYFLTELEQQLEADTSEYMQNGLKNSVIINQSIEAFTQASLTKEGVNRCTYYLKGIHFAISIFNPLHKSKEEIKLEISKHIYDFPAEEGKSSRCFIPASHLPKRTKRDEKNIEDPSKENKQDLRKSKMNFKPTYLEDNLKEDIKSYQQDLKKSNQPILLTENEDEVIKDRSLYPGLKSLPLSLAISIETFHIEHLLKDSILDDPKIYEMYNKIKGRNLTYGEFVLLLRASYPDFTVTTQVVKAQKDKDQRAFQMQVFNSVILIKLVDSMFIPLLKECVHDVLLDPGVDKYIDFQHMMESVGTTIFNFKLTIDMEKYGDMYPIEALEITCLVLNERGFIADSALRLMLYTFKCLRDRLMLMHPSLESSLQKENEEYIKKGSKHGFTQTIIQSSLSKLISKQKEKFIDLIDLTECLSKTLSFNKTLGFVLGSLNRIGSFLSDGIQRMTTWSLEKLGLTGVFNGGTHSDDEIAFTNIEVYEELEVTENIIEILTSDETVTLRKTGDLWFWQERDKTLSGSEVFLIVVGFMIFWSKVFGQTPSLLKWFFGKAGEVLQVQIIGRRIEVPLFRYATVILADLPGLNPGDDIQASVGRAYDLVVNNGSAHTVSNQLISINWLVLQTWGIKELDFNKPVHFGGSYYALSGDIAESGFDSNEIRLRSLFNPTELFKYSKIHPIWKPSKIEDDGISSYKTFNLAYLRNKKINALFNQLWQMSYPILSQEKEFNETDRRDLVVKKMRSDWLISSIAGDKSLVVKVIDNLTTLIADKTNSTLFKRRPGIKITNKRGYLKRTVNNPFVEGVKVPVMITIQEIWKLVESINTKEINSGYQLSVALMQDSVSLWKSRRFKWVIEEKEENWSLFPYQKTRQARSIALESVITRELLGVVIEILEGKTESQSKILRNKSYLLLKDGFLDNVTSIVNLLKSHKISASMMKENFNYFERILKGSEIRSSLAVSDTTKIFSSILSHYSLTEKLVITEEIKTSVKLSSKKIN
jgi:hypothetical protein